jgi:hypothetical protein
MEIIDENLDSSGGLSISQEDENNLRSFAKWGQFLAVMGYISFGVLAIFAIVFLFRFLSDTSRIDLGIYTAIYFVFASVYFYPNRCLWQCCEDFINGVDFKFQADFENGVKKLKYFYNYVMVLIALQLLMILFTVFRTFIN